MVAQAVPSALIMDFAHFDPDCAPLGTAHLYPTYSLHKISAVHLHTPPVDIHVSGHLTPLLPPDSQPSQLLRQSLLPVTNHSHLHALDLDAADTHSVSADT